MGWDFETEPDYEAKLTWARAFVDEEILPLETLELDMPALARAIGPLQDEVKAQGMWAAHLPPALGGMGFGQVRLGLLHEILGRSLPRPPRLREQRAGLRQRRAPRRRHRSSPAAPSTGPGGSSRCSTERCAVPSP